MKNDCSRQTCAAQTDIVTPRAPVGAKKMYSGHQNKKLISTADAIALAKEVSVELTNPIPAFYQLDQLGEGSQIP